MVLINRLAHLRPAFSAGAILGSALLIAAGCETRSPAVRPTAAVVAAPQQDELALALGAFSQMAEFRPDQTAARGVYYLNQWAESGQAPQVEWTADPLVQRLPALLQEMKPLKELDRGAHPLTDALYLQQHLWAKEIVQRVAAQDPPDDWQAWLDAVKSTQGEEAAEQLALAWRLFDWTAQHVQLDELLPPPKELVATVGADPAGAHLPPSIRGEPGPGYRFLPWETLLFGQGDAWERARVFILLARQAGVDAVMLATQETDKLGGTTPWLPAALIGGQLYLFDTQLALAIPGPEGRGIATLEQAVADPQLIRRLDLPGELPYRISNEQLGQVVALIDAEAESLTRRMRVLAAALKGQQKLALANAPTALAQQLRQCKHVGQVALWRVPFDALLFKASREERAQRDPEFAEQQLRDYGMYRGLTPIMRARQLHFRGVFDNQDDKPGARALYLSARPPDKETAKLERAEDLAELGINPASLPKDPMQREQAAQRQRALMTALATRGKQNSTYFLALTLVEEQNHELAAEWLRERILNADIDSPWRGGARYNLARSYEALGKWELACATYEQDDSPQRAGNRLRAQLLRARRSGGAGNANR